MFLYDSKQRISARDSLDHPFLSIFRSQQALSPETGSCRSDLDVTSAESSFTTTSEDQYLQSPNDSSETVTHNIDELKSTVCREIFDKTDRENVENVRSTSRNVDGPKVRNNSKSSERTKRSLDETVTIQPTILASRSSRRKQE